MSYEVGEEKLEELNKKLLEAFKKGVEKVEDEIYNFLEEVVPYE